MTQDLGSPAPSSSPQSSPLVSCLVPLLSPSLMAHGTLTARTVLPTVGNSLGFPDSGTGPLKWRSHLPRHLPGSPCSISRRGEEQVREMIRKGA